MHKPASSRLGEANLPFYRPIIPILTWSVTKRAVIRKRRFQALIDTAFANAIYSDTPLNETVCRTFPLKALLRHPISIL